MGHPVVNVNWGSKQNPACRPILVTAAEFDNSNGLQKTMDFASDHTIVFPTLALLFFVCQACVMVAAANFGTKVSLSQRCTDLSSVTRYEPALHFSVVLLMSSEKFLLTNVC